MILLITEDIHFNYEELEELDSNYFWTYGGEANLYRIPNGKKNIVIKLFYSIESHRFILSPRIIQNKKYKVGVLQKSRIPNKIQVYGRIFFEREFIGYMLNEAMNFGDFYLNTFRSQEQLIFLRKLKHQLQRLHELNMIFGDLKGDNILIHQTNYKLGCLCDLDNMQIGDFPIDVMSNYVEAFLHRYGKVDENLDWYVFNLLTLETLCHFDRLTYTPYKETRDFLKHYRGKSKILKSMRNLNPQYEGKLLIDDPSFYEDPDIPFFRR